MLRSQRSTRTHRIANQLVCITKRVAEKGFVVSTDGNLSCRLSKDEVLITPAGIHKSRITVNDLVQVDFKGNILYGTKRPSSELGLHLGIYTYRKDINAVIHAHPPYATAITLAGYSLEVPILPEVVVKLGKIPKAKYATPTTKELFKSVKPYLLRYNAVLLDRHGVVVVGEDIYEAYNILESVEHTAQVYIIARQIGSLHRLTKIQIQQLRKIKK